MYYPYFLTYMLSGLCISVVVLIWALNNGQFHDQKRARFLPLEDRQDRPPAKTSRISRIEIFGLFGLACGGLMAIAMVLTFAIIRSSGG